MPSQGGRNTRLSSKLKRRRPSLKKGGRGASNSGKEFQFAKFMFCASPRARKERSIKTGNYQRTTKVLEPIVCLNLNDKET